MEVDLDNRAVDLVDDPEFVLGVTVDGGLLGLDLPEEVDGLFLGGEGISDALEAEVVENLLHIDDLAHNGFCLIPRAKVSQIFGLCKHFPNYFWKK